MKSLIQYTFPGLKTSANIAHLHTFRDLSARREMRTPVMTKSRRLWVEGKLVTFSRAMENVATVEFYGHPSRCMAIAYPLPGKDWRDVSAAAREVAVVSGNVQCGNYIFPIL